MEFKRLNMDEIYITDCEKDTYVLGQALASRLNKGAILLLDGDMGAGKSVLARGIIRALGYEGAVTSPTFTLMNEYDTMPPVYHFDLYRLEYPEQLYDIGYEEYLYSDGISIIEWPSKMEFLKPDKFISVNIERLNENERKVTVSGMPDTAKLADSGSD
mgnify:FL=1